MTQRVQRFQCLSPSDTFTLLCPLVPHYTSREGDALFLVCFLTYLSRKTTSLTFSLLISIPNRCVWHLCSVVRGTFCLIVCRLQVPKWIHVFISWFLHLFAKMYFCVGVDVGQNCHKLKSSEKLISDLWECLLTLTWTRLLDARPFPVMFLSLFHQSCFKRLLMKKKKNCLYNETMLLFLTASPRMLVFGKCLTKVYQYFLHRFSSVHWYHSNRSVCVIYLCMLISW